MHIPLWRVSSLSGSFSIHRLVGWFEWEYRRIVVGGKEFVQLPLLYGQYGYFISPLFRSSDVKT